MNKIKETLDFVKTEAERFGAKVDREFNNSYVLRTNIGEEALNDKGAYFGFINPEEESSGGYHDFSFVIFPTDKDSSWLVTLVVGTLGFKNDYELSTLPGVRRLYSNIIGEEGFAKTHFSDIESSLPRDLINNEKLGDIRNTINSYSKFISACEIIDDPTDENGKKTISAFLAAYARIKGWPTNKDHRKAISDALEIDIKSKEVEDLEEVKELVTSRKFVVLQGPPGTGKTRMAKEIAKEFDAKVFFTQFHAETSFSDFIYGIRPNLKEQELNYTLNKGKLTDAIEWANANPNERVVLIIDEINRANLSNVLGPIFYLFEYQMKDSDVEIEITPDLNISILPKNLYVIATMNTADRSLAVVDFALRRRFAWYDLIPKEIGKSEMKKVDKTFFYKDFLEFQSIFNWYADNNELNLQPGQGYFIASDEYEMENRIRYELFPLIKEYLQEGLLKSATEEFNRYFKNRIGENLYE